MLVAEVTITVRDKAYEGGVNDAVAFTVDGWASGAPASFASSGRETIEMLVDGAVTQATTKAKDKLKILKGKS